MVPGSHEIPTGWTFVLAQDFEGTCPDDEWCGRYNGSVTATEPHTGNYSVEGRYDHDQADAGWSCDSGLTGAFTDLYLSFYELTSADASFNDSYLLMTFNKNVEAQLGQTLTVDWSWAHDASDEPVFNGPKATQYLVLTGRSEIGGVTERMGGVTDFVPTGGWVQWEAWLHPNTNDGTAGNDDGFLRVYRDGALFMEVADRNLVGTVDVSDAAVTAGGYYAKAVWMLDYPTCTVCADHPSQYESTDECTAAMDWWGQSFTDPHCGPSLLPFDRFIDDVLIMKRAP
jgi:hypothetical protein